MIRQRIKCDSCDQPAAWRIIHGLRSARKPVPYRHACHLHLASLMFREDIHGSRVEYLRWQAEDRAPDTTHELGDIKARLTRLKGYDRLSPGDMAILLELGTPEAEDVAHHAPADLATLIAVVEAAVAKSA